MAIIKLSELKKLNEKDREEKIKELRMALIKDRVASSKGGKIKIKEIKRTIARLLTINRQNRKVEVSKETSKSMDSKQKNPKKSIKK
ncbi:MAG: 50S ribosomal protein L29 [Candidatus Pacearchaeota archaeon]|jgi:ribosomal protein L29